MKSMYKKMIGVFLLSAVMVACKQSETPEGVTSTANDTIKMLEQEKQITETVKDSIKKKFARYSLNELMKFYNDNVKLESTVNYQMAIMAANEIKDRREIPLSEYKTYTEEFWGVGVTPMKKNLTRQEILNLVGVATDKEFIKFTFDDQENANFNPIEVVKTHSFASGASCIPALTLRKMVRDTLFSKLEVTKGKQTNPPGYTGTYLITVFIYTDTKNKVQYFDIVSDPTIDESGT